MGWVTNLIRQSSSAQNFHVSEHESLRVSELTAELESLKAELASERSALIAAEKQIAAERSRLRAIINAFPSHIFLKDCKNNILFLNQSGAEALGLAIEEVEGHSAYELYPESASRFYKDDLEVIKSGTPKTGIIEQIESRTAENRWVSTSKFPWRDADGEIRGVAVVAHDITEIVRQGDDREGLMAQVAEALRSSEERYYLAIRGSKDGFWDWNILTGDVFLSPRYKEMLGYRDDELSSSIEIMGNHIHPEDLPRVWENAHRHLYERHPYYCEFRMRTRDGNWKWFSSNAQAIWDREGRPYRMAGCIRDITERKRTEQNLNEFFSTVSHELRTPLAAVKGSLRLIEAGLAGQITNDTRELLDIALASCERLIRLVNDILDLRKIETGKMELHLDQIDAADLVAEVVSHLGSYAGSHGVDLSVSSSEEIAFEADRDRVVQVLTNLIGNAVKFSGDSCAVTVNVEKLEDRYVRFSVVDNGPGIPLDQQQLLFQKFKQLDSSDSRRQDGTGLGLAICKAIVGQHHGRIGVESAAGEGATFWFDLPLKQ